MNAMLLERDLAPPKVALPQTDTAAVAAIDWRRMRRAAKTVAIAIVVIFGALLLLRQASTIGRGAVAVTREPGRARFAALLVATTYVAAAVAITAASGRRLPLGRTSAVQLAAVCTNRVAPAGLGAMATNARFLELDGASRSQALTAVGVSTIASFAAHAIVTVTVLLLVHRPVGALLHLPADSLLALLFVIAAAIAVAVLVAPRFAPRLIAPLREGRSAVASVCTDPRRLGRLLLGAVGVTLGHGLAFVAAVAACVVRLPVASLLAVFLAGSAVGSTAPTPGGLGALEAALVAGLTALGAPRAPQSRRAQLPPDHLLAADHPERLRPEGARSHCRGAPDAARGTRLRVARPGGWGGTRATPPACRHARSSAAPLT
jgi:uncharacterized membrane protein YbhN (UPF0104 family)